MFLIVRANRSVRTGLLPLAGGVKQFPGFMFDSFSHGSRDRVVFFREGYRNFKEPKFAC
jgi:hypothetical protein